MINLPVSVIIPTYNSENTIGRALQSISRQTLLPTEVILVDDCSPHKEMATILENIRNQYSKYFDVKIIKLTKNGGPGTARNVGWDVAKGAFVAFLDSDDAWHPQKLEIQYKLFEDDSELAFCHHDSDVDMEKYEEFLVHKYSEDNIKTINISAKRWLFKHYGYGCTSTVMVKNISDVRFKEGKRAFEDYLVWLQFNFKYKGIYIDQKLSCVFKNMYGDGGLSGDLWNMEKGELETYSILRQQGYISFPLYCACSAFSLLKYVRRVVICLFRK